MVILYLTVWFGDVGQQTRAQHVPKHVAKTCSPNVCRTNGQLEITSCVASQSEQLRRITSQSEEAERREVRPVRNAFDKRDHKRDRKRVRQPVSNVFAKPVHILRIKFLYFLHTRVSVSYYKVNCLFRFDRSIRSV